MIESLAVLVFACAVYAAGFLLIGARTAAITLSDYVLDHMVIVAAVLIVIGAAILCLTEEEETDAPHPR